MSLAAHVPSGSARSTSPRSGSSRSWVWQVPAAVVLAALSLLVPPLSAVPLLYVAAVTPQLVRVDLREHRLPNRLVVPGLLIAVVALGAQWAADGVPPVVPLIAGASYFVFLMVLAAFGGMGMGDVKLGALLGLVSPGLGVAVLSPALAFMFGGIAGVVLMAKHGRGASVAFGPYLLGGFWIAFALSLLR